MLGSFIWKFTSALLSHTNPSPNCPCFLATMAKAPCAGCCQGGLSLTLLLPCPSPWGENSMAPLRQVHPDTQEARIPPGLPLGLVGTLPQLRQTFTNRVCTPGLMLQTAGYAECSMNMGWKVSPKFFLKTQNVPYLAIESLQMWSVKMRSHWILWAWIHWLVSL